jgi:hypothetical protein
MSGEVFDRFGKHGAITGFVVAEEPSRFGAVRERLADAAQFAGTTVDFSKTAETLRHAVFNLRKSLNRQDPPPLDSVFIPREVGPAFDDDGQSGFDHSTVAAVDAVSDDDLGQAAGRPARQNHDRQFFLGLSAAGLAIAASLALFPAADTEMPRETGTIVASEPAEPVWREVVRPFRIFVLESRALASRAFEYRARSRDDGRREDLLIYRDPGQSAGMPAALMVVARGDAPEADASTLYTDSVMRAAEFGGAVLRASMPAPLTTKFGAFEVADLRIGTGTGEISCLAFRHKAAEAPIQLSGWNCGQHARAIDRPNLRCFIDRLDIMSAGESVWLRNYFSQSEADRQVCATKAASALPETNVEGTGNPVLKRDITGSVDKAVKPKKARVKKVVTKNAKAPEKTKAPAKTKAPKPN